MGTDIPESDLVRRAQNGSSAAFEKLFAACEDRLLDRVRHALAPVLRGKVSAEDILQESFLVAYRRLAEFESRGEGSFYRWLERIALLWMKALTRHYLGTAKRDVRREVSWRADGAAADIAGFDPTASQIVMAQELGEQVSRAMNELSPNHREILHLVLDENATYEEVAVRMQRSLPAVRKLYERALARLAARLKLPSPGGS